MYIAGKGRGRQCMKRNLPSDEIVTIPPPVYHAKRDFANLAVDYDILDNIIPPPVAIKKQDVQLAGIEDFGLRLDRLPVFQCPLLARPGYGKAGTIINLIANCFRIDIPNGYVYHYDVDIYNKNQYNKNLATFVALDEKTKYRCLHTKKNREIINVFIDSNKDLKEYYPVYDGRKNLYTRQPLKNVPFTSEVTVSKGESSKTKSDTFIVAIKPVRKKETKSCAINLDTIHAFFDGRVNNFPQEALTALETVLRNSPCMKFIPIGRSFYHPPGYNENFPISGGREIWFGYHQSIRIGEWSPFVNLDMSATVFYEKGLVLDFLCKVFNWRKENLQKRPLLSDFEIKRISKELKNLKVQPTHLNYKKTCTVIAVTRQPANKMEFTLIKEGKPLQMKVSEYFSSRYGYNLQYPHLPCLQVSPESKNTYLPIEVCYLVEGQHYNKRLTDEQRKDMIKFTSHQPKERFAKIQEIFQRANFNEDIACKKFELRVNPTPLRLRGRVLEPPDVCYTKTQALIPREGHWEMKDRKFTKGGETKKWVLLSFADEEYCSKEDLEKFTLLLICICTERGITIGKPVLTEIFQERQISTEAILETMKNEYGADLAMIVLSQTDKTTYAHIKRIAETVLGLKTQCIKDSTVMKFNPSVVKNVSLKLNAKLGGVNHFLGTVIRSGLMRKPIIIIGADVTHPMPTESVKSSVAAVVGSTDAYLSRYAATFRAQLNIKENKKGTEIIADLKVMIMEVLRAFYKNTNGKKPEKIIFYRDGVSEGQFESVKSSEIQAIRQACQSLSLDYKPAVTFIVVQKRHHIRFHTEDARDGVGRCRNAPPGTIVDQTIIHPSFFDFYLCSHNSHLGTSRPAYYTVLADDSKFTADQLQQLTYQLCYAYARCNKSISVPSPIMYAHLAAFRARQLLLSHADDNASSSGNSSKSFDERELKSIKVLASLTTSMYFV